MKSTTLTQSVRPTIEGRKVSFRATYEPHWDYIGNRFAYALSACANRMPFGVTHEWAKDALVIKVMEDATPAQFDTAVARFTKLINRWNNEAGIVFA